MGWRHELHVNPLRPNGTCMHQWTRSSLVPSLYGAQPVLEPYWFIVNLRNKLQWIFNLKSNNFILDNAFQKCKVMDSLNNWLNRYSPSIYIYSIFQILPLLWYISRNIHMVLYVSDPMYFYGFHLNIVSLSKMSLSTVSYWYIADSHLDYC